MQARGALLTPLNSAVSMGRDGRMHSGIGPVFDILADSDRSCLQNGPKPPWKSGYMATCPGATAPPTKDGRKGRAGMSSDEGYYEADPDDPVCLGECVDTYMQCGGDGGKFAKAFKRCCNPADHCVRKNAFYSQCRPASQSLPARWPGARVIDCSTPPLPITSTLLHCKATFISVSCTFGASLRRNFSATGCRAPGTLLPPQLLISVPARRVVPDNALLCRHAHVVACAPATAHRRRARRSSRI